MALQIKKRENTDFEKKLYTGVTSLTPRGVNPDKATMGKMYGNDMPEDMKEPEYESTDKDKNEVVTICFYSQDDTHPDKPWFTSRFRLTDKEVVSVKKNDNGDEITKYQYVNATGGSAYAEKESDLPEWFRHFQDKDKNNIADKAVRKAIQGEANLYNFLTAYLGKVDWFDVNSNILIDVKRVFRNVNKFIADEYLPLVKSQLEVDATPNGPKKVNLRSDLMTGTVGAMATVYTGEKDGAVVHYQNLYNDYLPEYKLKKVITSCSTNNWTDKSVAGWYKQLTGQFGCKDAYTLSLLQLFDPNADITTTAETFREPQNTTSAPVIDAAY